MLSPMSNLSAVVANGFSNWPFATCFLKNGRVVDFENVVRGLLFYCVQLILSNCTDINP